MLANPLVRGGVEGTANAAATASPDQQGSAALKNAFDQEYQDTAWNYYVYNEPADFRDQVENRITAALPDVDDTTLSNVSSAIDEQLQRFSSGRSRPLSGARRSVQRVL